MELLINTILGTLGVIISCLIGLIAFPAQIRTIKKNKSVTNVNVSIGSMTMISYTTWLGYAITHSHGIDIFLLVSNIPGLINSIRLTLLLKKYDRKIIKETIIEIKELIKSLFK